MSHKKWHRYSNRWQDKPWWLRQLRRYVRKDLELDEVLAREREQGDARRLQARRRRVRLRAQAEHVFHGSRDE